MNHSKKKRPFDELLVRLWPLFNLAGIIAIVAGLVLFALTIAWYLGYLDLTSIFPTMSPFYGMVAGGAVAALGWHKWNDLRKRVAASRSRVSGATQFDQDRLTPLLELASLFTGDPSLLDEIRLAYDNPAMYVERFSDSLEDRGVYGPIPQLPWLALVDGLVDRNLLIELDWKVGPEESVPACHELLERIAPGQRASLRLDAATLPDDDDIPTVLAIANQQLKEANLQIVSLNIQSDCYPLAALPLDALPRAQDLAKEANYGTIDLA